jgi:hypothetical protein
MRHSFFRPALESLEHRDLPGSILLTGLGLLDRTLLEALGVGEGVTAPWRVYQSASAGGAAEGARPQPPLPRADDVPVQGARRPSAGAEPLPERAQGQGAPGSGATPLLANSELSLDELFVGAEGLFASPPAARVMRTKGLLNDPAPAGAGGGGGGGGAGASTALLALEVGGGGSGPAAGPGATPPSLL